MDSIQAYESKAKDFLGVRDTSEIGSQVVHRWAQHLSCDAAVLELACGGGLPITRVLQLAKLRLWAIDSSPTLVSTFKDRFPNIPVQCEAVQESTFFDQHYDGVIAIGLIFLLPQQDQRELITKIANIVYPGGRFLFTAPIEKASWKDMNTGLLCQSLGQADYEECLERSGLKTLSTFTDAGSNNYYDTRKIG